jgi:hypothetical protein
MKLISTISASTSSPQYKRLLQAKKHLDTRFAHQMARDINRIINYPRHAIAFLPDGVLTRYMPQYLRVRSLLVPKKDPAHKTKALDRKQRFGHNPYTLPAAYVPVIMQASTIIIIDDLTVSGSTIYHLTNLVKQFTKPRFAVVWLRVIE